MPSIRTEETGKKVTISSKTGGNSCFRVSNRDFPARTESKREVGGASVRAHTAKHPEGPQFFKQFRAHDKGSPHPNVKVANGTIDCAHQALFVSSRGQMYLFGANGAFDL